MKNLVLFSMCLGCVFAAVTGRAIDLKQSKVTQVVNDVQIISAASQTQKHATVDDVFAMPDILRTGAASRAELVAADQTVTRVGANTIFSFDPENRTLDLKQGSLLFHAPHGKGGGTIHTGSATASVLGTTLIVVTTPNGGFKVIALEGKVEVNFLNGLKQKLDPGQMTFILPGANHLAPVIIFRLDELTANSLLVKGFEHPLDSTHLIQNEILLQDHKIHNGKLTDTPYYAGDNANANDVEVLDINTVSHGTPPGKNPNDVTINQPSLTDPSVPTPPDHVQTDKSFPVPNNPYFNGQQFIGFLGMHDIYLNTALGQIPLAVDLSPYSDLAEFDMVAANNFYFAGSVIFQGLRASSIFQLIAGNQFIFAPGISLTAGTQNLVMESPASLTLNNDAINNPLNNVFIEIGGDVTLQNNSLIYAAAGLAIYSGGNIAVNNSTLACDTAQLTAFNGDISFDSATLNASSFAIMTALNGISINNSTLNGGSSLLISAANDLNITGTTKTGSSLNTDPANGSVNLSSSHGSINVSGTSITAQTLTLNSGDGILLDGSGHTFTTSGPGATANFTAPNSVTINNANFGSFGAVNMAAKTIVLMNDVLALINNFGCQSGHANFSGPAIGGDVNFYNCTWQNNAVTSDNVTYSGGVVNAAGVHVYKNP